MKEQPISLETAILAKEKGYNWLDKLPEDSQVDIYCWEINKGGYSLADNNYLNFNHGGCRFDTTRVSNNGGSRDWG